MIDLAEAARVLVIGPPDFIDNEAGPALREHYAARFFTQSDTGVRYLRANGAELLFAAYEFWNKKGSPLREALADEPLLRKIPIVFFAEAASPDDELEKSGFFYFTRPLKPGVLRGIARAHLELGHYRRHLEQMAEERAAEIMTRYNRQMQRDDATLELLARVTDMRGDESAMHLTRITAFTGALVKELQNARHPDYTLDDTAAGHIIRAVKLHDIGKIGIPESILLKPEKLSNDELEQMKQHPRHGAALIDRYVASLGEDAFIQTIRDIVLYHHEKWDGSGYPGGIAGKNIPISSRIAALADVYDALVTVKPYKPAISHEQAMVVIKNNSEKYFDPFLVEIFLRLEGRFKELAQTIV